MPTLLQIGSSSNYGAPGKITEQIGLLAENLGWKSYVAHGPRLFNPSKLHDFTVNTRFDELIHGLIYSLLLDRHGLGSARATKLLIKKIETEIKPDIIHLHNIHGYFINYKILFDYLAKSHIPVVWTLHDCWTFTGHCAYFTISGCDKWQTQCKNCPSIKDYPTSLFYDRSERNFRDKKKAFNSVNNVTFVPVSNWLAQYLGKSFLSRHPRYVIHNGIDIGVFRPQKTDELIEKHNLIGKKILLGVANPWNQRKGLADWFELRSLLSEDYALVLIGLSEKQIASLPDGILGLGKTQNAQELAAYYTAADIFLNTTYEDNYPTVNLEAIACGTPVITYNTGGSPESITPETGRVVNKGDIKQLVKAVHSLEKENQKQLQTNCRLYAEKYFDRRKCFQQYIDLYYKILNNSNVSI